MNRENIVTLPNQLPVPPVEMVMPQLINMIVTVVSFSILFIVAIFLLRTCRKNNTLLPILFLLGGMFSYITEPLLDLLVCVWYPDINTISFLRAFNVSVPVWVIAPWGFFMGGQAWWLYSKFVQGMPAVTLWKLLPVFWVLSFLVEIPALHFGLHYYYGPQAFKVLGFPLWMGLANASTPVVVAALFYSLRGFFIGPRVWLVVVLFPVFCLAGEAVGWPMWVALNSGLTETGTMLATIPVVGLACLVTYIVSHTICIPQASLNDQRN